MTLILKQEEIIGNKTQSLSFKHLYLCAFWLNCQVTLYLFACLFSVSFRYTLSSFMQKSILYQEQNDWRVNISQLNYTKQVLLFVIGIFTIVSYLSKQSKVKKSNYFSIAISLSHLFRRCSICSSHCTLISIWLILTYNSKIID